MNRAQAAGHRVSGASAGKGDLPPIDAFLAKPPRDTLQPRLVLTALAVSVAILAIGAVLLAAGLAFLPEVLP